MCSDGRGPRDSTLAHRASVAGYELLPKNSNNSPRDTTSQNNSIVISVCNLACAARFRANAGSKSVGMIGRPQCPPLLLRNNPYRAVAVPYLSLQDIAEKVLERWRRRTR